MGRIAQLAAAAIELASVQDICKCCDLLQRCVTTLGEVSCAVTCSNATEAYEVGTIIDSPASTWRNITRSGQGYEGTGVRLQLHADPDPDASWLIDVLAQLTTAAIARIDDVASLDRHERQQVALMEASSALNSERTLDGVLRRIVEQAMTLTGAKYGALGVLDASGETLDEFVTAGIDDETRELIGDLPIGTGITGVLIEDPRPLRLKRLQDHPRSVGFPEHHPYMETFLGVPIVTARAIKGRLYLAEKQGAPEFTATDERLVISLAAQAAIAVDNAALNDELRAAAAELARSSRHKSTFLANMSHELRSPLNTIIGYTRLLLEQPKRLDDEQIEDLQIVRESSEHLLALITDLLDLQQIEAGKITLVPRSESLTDIVTSVIASVRPLVAAPVDLAVDTAALVNPLVWCDQTRIRQVLLNVLGNAAKFTTRGSITLTACDSNDQIVLTVRDTGPGIAVEDQERIFDAFYQSDVSAGIADRVRDGAGLGLAITRTLTELHGGTVALASAADSGTAVTIELPRYCTGAPPHAATSGGSPI